MTKTIIICGYGPGISKAVAEKFGTQGFSVALVARRPEVLTAGVKELAAKGVKAAAFPANLADVSAVKTMVAEVHAGLGPITAIHWNAYSGAAGDLLTASADEIQTALGLATTSLVSAVQAALPDLRKDTSSAILVTNGGLGFFDPKVDAVGVQWNAMGLSVANAAKHKLVGLLSAKLAPEGVYVGEVCVMNVVKGSAFDKGNGTIEAATIADTFWSLYSARRDVSANVG